MANAGTFIQVLTGGSDTANGGAFDTGNTSMATDGAATSANTASPVFSSASYTFVAGDVGARLYIKSGTNWIPGWYTIASISSGKATLNATAGQATLSTGYLTPANGCATTASPTSATWSVDYSQQSSPRYSYTDLVIGTTTTQCTSAANPFGKNCVGNFIVITGGAGFTTGRYEINSVSGTTATCSSSLGTASSTGGTGGLGGALASPGMATALYTALSVNGLCIQIGPGTYTLTTSTSNVSGGQCSIGFTSVNNTAAYPWTIEGYAVTTGDQRQTPPTAGHPIISAGSVTGLTNGIILTQINSFGTGGRGVLGITVDGNNGANNAGMNALGNTVLRCKAQNCAAGSLLGSLVKECQVTNCTGGFWATTNIITYVDCEAWGNAGAGFASVQQTAAEVFIRCLSYGNTGSNGYGFWLGDANNRVGYSILIDCVAYGNAQDGFHQDATGNFLPTVLENCIAEANGGFGFKSASATNALQLKACAAYGNTSGAISNITSTENFVSGTTGSFFTNASGADFSTNNFVNQGALLRGTGYPGPMPRGITIGYLDIGAVQHQDPGGGTTGFFY